MVHMRMEKEIDNMESMANSVQKQIKGEREWSALFPSLITSITETLHRIEGHLDRLEKNSGEAIIRATMSTTTTARKTIARVAETRKDKLEEGQRVLGPWLWVVR